MQPRYLGAGEELSSVFYDLVLADARSALSGMVSFHAIFVPAEDRKFDEILNVPTYSTGFHFPNTQYPP